jgi:cytochrome c
MRIPTPNGASAMKRPLVILAAAAAVFAAGAVNADSMDDLKAKGCLGCHDMDKKKVGPAIKDIAAKHKSDKTAADKIATKVATAKGHPKSKVTDEAEAKKLVEAMLAAK